MDLGACNIVGRDRDQDLGEQVWGQDGHVACVRAWGGDGCWERQLLSYHVHIIPVS